jgi:hypothetical protein
LRDEENEQLHTMWRELTADPKFASLHHYDVVALALTRLQGELQGEERAELLRYLEARIRRSGGS